jgi:hypothetical protein
VKTRSGAVAVVAISVAALAAGSAQAEVDLRVNSGYRHESNLFRQSKALPNADQQSGSRSDDVFSLGGTVTAEVNPGNFNTVLQLDAGQEWYRRNSALNNFNYTAQAAVTRETGGIVGLRLDALSQRSLSSYADIRTRLRNVQDLQRVTGEFTLPITPDIRLVANPEFTQSQNSADIVKVNDFRQYGTGVGVGWFSPIGNSIAVTVSQRYTDGLSDRTIPVSETQSVLSRINLVDTGVGVKLRYAPSVLTSIEANVGIIRRNDRSVLNNDYTGPSGEVILRYMPRDSFRVSLTAGRRLEAQSYIFIDSVRSDYAAATVVAQVMDQLTLNGRLDIGWRIFRYDPLSQLPQLTDRRERLFRLAGGAEYRLLGRLLLGARAAYDQRRSNIALGGYKAMTIAATASVAFGNRKATVF